MDDMEYVNIECSVTHIIPQEVSFIRQSLQLAGSQ